MGCVPLKPGSCPYCRKPVETKLDHPNVAYDSISKTQVAGPLTNHWMAYCAECDVWLVLEKGS